MLWRKHFENECFEMLPCVIFVARKDVSSVKPTVFVHLNLEANFPYIGLKVPPIKFQSLKI